MKCPKCTREFDNKYALNAHLQAHDAKPLQCPNCNRLCKGERGLSRHLVTCKPARKTTSEPPLSNHQQLQYCPHCGLNLAIISQALAVAKKLGV